MGLYGMWPLSQAVFSRFMYTVAYISTAFFWWQHPIVRTYHILLIPQLVDIWVASAVAIMTQAIVNIHVLGFTGAHSFSSFGYTPWRGIAGSYGYSNFLRNCQPIFQRNCTILYPASNLQGSNFFTLTRFCPILFLCPIECKVSKCLRQPSPVHLYLLFPAGGPTQTAIFLQNRKMSVRFFLDSNLLNLHKVCLYSMKISIFVLYMKVFNLPIN